MKKNTKQWKSSKYGNAPKSALRKPKFRRYDPIIAKQEEFTLNDVRDKVRELTALEITNQYFNVKSLSSSVYLPIKEPLGLKDLYNYNDPFKIQERKLNREEMEIIKYDAWVDAFINIPDDRSSKERNDLKSKFINNFGVGEEMFLSMILKQFKVSSDDFNEFQKQRFKNAYYKCSEKEVVMLNQLNFHKKIVSLITEEYNDGVEQYEFRLKRSKEGLESRKSTLKQRDNELINKEKLILEAKETMNFELGCKLYNKIHGLKSSINDLSKKIINLNSEIEEIEENLKKYEPMLELIKFLTDKAQQIFAEKAGINLTEEKKEPVRRLKI